MTYTFKLKPYIIEKGLIRVIGKWVYVPVRYDDPDVKALAPADKHEDMGFLTGCVFGWLKKWIPENGYVKNDYPEELEIYGLNDGYDFPNGNGANITLGVPII